MASRRLKRHRKNNAKYDSDKDDRNPTDEVLAAESLANYMRSNNSFVMDVFQVCIDIIKDGKKSNLSHYVFNIFL